MDSDPFHPFDKTDTQIDNAISSLLKMQNVVDSKDVSLEFDFYSTTNLWKSLTLTL